MSFEKYVGPSKHAKEKLVCEIESYSIQSKICEGDEWLNMDTSRIILVGGKCLLSSENVL